MSAWLTISRLSRRGASRLAQSWTCASAPKPTNEVATRLSSGSSGDGSGRGGGSGGSIRDAGGAFGKREHALEEKFFREEQARQIKMMREVMTERLKTSISYHEKQLALYSAAIKKHKDEIEKNNMPAMNKIHVSLLSDSIREEEDQLKKLHDLWKKLHL